MITEFTPWQSLLGGMLIGVAASLLMATNGRIAGISGILSRLLPPASTGGPLLQGACFVAGLLLAAPLFQLGGASIEHSVQGSWPLLITAGLLVGLGSRLGSGCTSGHGVCGISRLSPRSLVATLVFMLCAICTVYLLRHVVGGLT